MKKFNKYGYAGAIALATAMSFTACSSDDEMENINPTYDGNSVKTQFAISLTQKANKGGRMATEEALPGNGSNVATFYGLKDMRLYEFDEAITAATTYDVLQPLASRDAVNLSNINALVYTDVTIPVGTSHFLFYGENAATGKATPQGKIVQTWANETSKTVETTKFAPYTILTDYADFATGVTAYETLLNDLYGYLADDALVAANVETLLSTFEALNTASSDHVLILMNTIYKEIVKLHAATDALNPLKAKLETVKTNFAEKFDVDGSNNLTWKAAINPQFPTKYGLPSGAVAVDFVSGAFDILETSTPSANPNNEALADYENFAYPPTLMYFANSPVKASNIKYLAKENTTPSADWATFVAQYQQNSVTSMTQSVVLANQVNFGMAQLKSSVKFAAATVNDAKGTAVDVTSGFPVTGILIGNQKGAKWDFTYDDAPTEVYTIYDKEMTDAAMSASNAASAYNYTLVFESKPAADDKDAKGDVLVAIELQNNGDEFVGYGNQKVPAGAKFYLVGKLEVNKGKVGGSVHDFTKFSQVFVQDHVTVADFTISTLANAYNTIPDLDTPTMEFGLSVDLTWQTGLTFDVTIP